MFMIHSGLDWYQRGLNVCLRKKSSGPGTRHVTIGPSESIHYNWLFFLRGLNNTFRLSIGDCSGLKQGCWVGVKRRSTDWTQ